MADEIFCQKSETQFEESVIVEIVLSLIMVVGIYLVFFKMLWPSRPEREPRSKLNWRKERKEWLCNIEPLQRAVRGYPKDWERRRALAYIQADGICASCRMKCGRLLCSRQNIWRYESDEMLLTEAHVHHKIPLSKHGDNSLSSLQLLCAACHLEKHPGNANLMEEKCKSIARSIRFSYVAAVHKARKEYGCTICGCRIQRGQHYFGETSRGHYKICLVCYSKYNIIRGY